MSSRGSKFYVLVHSREPYFVIDGDKEDGSPAAFKSLHDAQLHVMQGLHTRTVGATILEWNDHGLVCVHE